MYLCPVKNADTREQILHLMFTDIHKNGFQGLRADKVVSSLGITKGAMYHYFPNKQSIGIAVIDEIIKPNYLHFYHELNSWTGNPIDKIQQNIRFLSDKCTAEELRFGCPLNNLVQEMCPIDEHFRVRLQTVVDGMARSVADALRRGQAAGTVKTDIDPDAIAQFYLSALEGSYGMTKARKDVTAFRASLQILCQFFDGLRT
jgi:AcrR family transcriptional regulator